jgi:hypothetical protein
MAVIPCDPTPSVHVRRRRIGTLIVAHLTSDADLESRLLFQAKVTSGSVAEGLLFSRPNECGNKMISSLC